jgi:hypothetical protein
VTAPAPGQAVFTWDYRQPAPMDEIAAAVRELSGGVVHMSMPETGGDEYKLVISHAEPGPELAADLREAQHAARTHRERLQQLLGDTPFEFRPDWAADYEDETGDVSVPEPQPAPELAAYEAEHAEWPHWAEGESYAFKAGMRVRTAPCPSPPHHGHHFQVRAPGWTCGLALAATLVNAGVIPPPDGTPEQPAPAVTVEALAAVLGEKQILVGAIQPVSEGRWLAWVAYPDGLAVQLLSAIDLRLTDPAPELTELRGQLQAVRAIVEPYAGEVTVGASSTTVLACAILEQLPS